MTLLWSTAYDTNDVTQAGWMVEQNPEVGGVSVDRITAVTAPDGAGANTWKPTAKVMRVELRPWSSTNPGSESPADGDVNPNAGGTNRAEVYARHAVPAGATVSIYAWPDGYPGAQRWYSWSEYLPADFAVSGYPHWMVTTQWKGFRGGSAPVAFEFGSNDPTYRQLASNPFGFRLNLTPVSNLIGKWTRWVVGIGWSNNATGSIEVWMGLDGETTLTRVAYLPSQQTLQNVDSSWNASIENIDPTYFKHGIYRSHDWATTNIIYYGTEMIGTTRADVDTTLVTPSPQPPPSGEAVPATGEYWGVMA